MKSSGLKRDKYDKMVSDVVRYRDRYTCQRCYTFIPPPTAEIQCAHLKSRAHGATRYDLRNCDGLCARCHGLFTLDHAAHRRWKVERHGIDLVCELENLARKPMKLYQAEKEVMYLFLKDLLTSYRADFEKWFAEKRSHYENLPF